MATAKIYNGTGWDEISGGSRWDYQQDTRPSTPTESGVTWLRTTDFVSFVFDQPNSEWFAMGMPARLDVTGPDSGPPTAAAATKQAWSHAAAMNALGKSWKTPYRCVVTDMSINSHAVVVPSDWGIQIVENAVVVHTLYYDGSVASKIENDIGLIIGNNKRVTIQLVVGAGGGGAYSSFRWNASINYKWAVTG